MIVSLDDILGGGSGVASDRGEQSEDTKPPQRPPLMLSVSGWRSLALLLEHPHHCSCPSFVRQCFIHAIDVGDWAWIHTIFRLCNATEIPCLLENDSFLLRHALGVLRRKTRALTCAPASQLRTKEKSSFLPTRDVCVLACGCFRLRNKNTKGETIVNDWIDSWNVVLCLIAPPCIRHVHNDRHPLYEEPDDDGALGLETFYPRVEAFHAPFECYEPCLPVSALPDINTMHGELLLLAVASRNITLIQCIISLSDGVYAPELAERGIDGGAGDSAALQRAFEWASELEARCGYECSCDYDGSSYDALGNSCPQCAQAVLGGVCQRIIDAGGRCSDNQSHVVYTAVDYDAPHCLRWLLTHRFSGCGAGVCMNDSDNLAFKHATVSGAFECAMLLIRADIEDPCHVAKAPDFLAGFLDISSAVWDYNACPPTRIFAFRPHEKRALYSAFMDAHTQLVFEEDTLDLEPTAPDCDLLSISHEAFSVAVESSCVFMSRRCINELGVDVNSSYDGKLQSPLEVAFMALREAVNAGAGAGDVADSMDTLAIFTERSVLSRLCPLPQNDNDRVWTVILSMLGSWGRVTQGRRTPKADWETAVRFVRIVQRLCEALIISPNSFIVLTDAWISASRSCIHAMMFEMIHDTKVGAARPMAAPTSPVDHFSHDFGNPGAARSPMQEFEGWPVHRAIKRLPSQKVLTSIMGYAASSNLLFHMYIGTLSHKILPMSAKGAIYKCSRGGGGGAERKLDSVLHPLDSLRSSSCAPRDLLLSPEKPRHSGIRSASTSTISRWCDDWELRNTLQAFGGVHMGGFAIQSMEETTEVPDSPKSDRAKRDIVRAADSDLIKERWTGIHTYRLWKKVLNGRWCDRAGRIVPALPADVATTIISIVAPGVLHDMYSYSYRYSGYVGLTWSAAAHIRAHAVMVKLWHDNYTYATRKTKRRLGRKAKIHERGLYTLSRCAVDCGLICGMRGFLLCG